MSQILNQLEQNVLDKILQCRRNYSTAVESFLVMKISLLQKGGRIIDCLIDCPVYKTARNIVDVELRALLKIPRFRIVRIPLNILLVPHVSDQFPGSTVHRKIYVDLFSSSSWIE